MNILTKIWKAPGQLWAKALHMIFPSGGSTLLGRLLPRTRFNYAQSTDATLSAPVMACVNWIVRNFPEAPIIVRKRDSEDNWEIDHKHPLTLLMRRPNPFYSGPLLLMALMSDFIMGNGYLRKIRSAGDRVVELWWLPAVLVTPKWPESGEVYISHYEYAPGGTTTPEKIPPEDIVHLRWGLDPANTRLGLSPLKSVLREIFTDDEAANFSASLLRNLGVPGVILSPKEGTMGGNKADLEATKKQFRENFGGDNRGDVLVMSGPTEAHVLSFSPEQMNLRSIRRIPEERISAVLGIPAIVAGLGAGLDRSTFANMKEAREMAYENGLIPLQRIVGAEFTTQLLVDFGAIEGAEVAFDLREVRVLQEDENAKATRVQGLVTGGTIKRSEARAQLGYPIEPGDDIYYVPISVDERRPGEEPATEPGTELSARAGTPALKNGATYP